jgi:hypothetical protein
MSFVIENVVGIGMKRKFGTVMMRICLDLASCVVI